MDSIKNRRTIRKYKQQDIPDDLLNGLLEEAFRAPTMGNMQLYSVIVTRDPAMKERLAPAHFHQPMLTEAPVVLTFCADFNRFVKWCRQRKAEPGYDNLLSFMNASIDAIMLTQNFCTLAEAAGLGTCFLGTTIYNPDQIIEVLNLPERVIPLATITVGYPTNALPRPTACPWKALSIKNNTMTIRPRTSTASMPTKSRCPRINILWKSTIPKRWHRFSPTSATQKKETRLCRKY